MSQTEQELKIGDRVRIHGDGDGAEGEVATIRAIYKSGRCCVDLPKGGFRNLPQKSLELVK